jgi:hypothetical protein
VGNYQSLFDLIEHGSHTVAVEDDRVVLAADILTLDS